MRDTTELQQFPTYLTSFCGLSLRSPLKTNACSEFEIYINNKKSIVERCENWHDGEMAGTWENHINGSLWSISPRVTSGRLMLKQLYKSG